jgi:hypothetical protein
MPHSEIEPNNRIIVRSAGQTCTDITKAILTGADMRGVDLRHVRGLTRQQLRTARIDASTLLPVGLRLVRAIERLVQQLRQRRCDRQS